MTYVLLALGGTAVVILAIALQRSREQNARLRDDLAVERKGRTIVPLAMYWKNGRAKLEIGLAKGKKEHDKRADKRDRDWERERARVMKGRR